VLPTICCCLCLPYYLVIVQANEYITGKNSREQVQVKPDNTANNIQRYPSTVTKSLVASGPSTGVATTTQKLLPVVAQPVQPSGLATTKQPSMPSVVVACSICLQRGTINKQGTGKASDRCNVSGVSHPWEANKAYVLMPSRKRVNQLPKRIPMNSNFALCRHMLSKRDCNWVNGGCQFAHSQEEIDLWKWMVVNNGNIYFIVLIANT
jgi:hypothetical protein